MAVPICPIDKIIVQFDKKFQDEIVTKSGIKFYQDPTFNPEWQATVTGTVVSIPKRISYPIVPQVKVGDELVFSYLVVYDRIVREDDEAFYETTPENDRHHEFENGRKETIKVMHLTPKLSAGIYMAADKKTRLDGRQGGPKEVGRWLSQYKIGKHDHMVYTNLLPFNEQDFWLCDYQFAIAVKREGEIIMIGGNCLLEPSEERMVYERGPNMQLDLITKVDKGVATLLNIGEPLKTLPRLNAKPGDRVHFNQDFVQRYEMWGKKYFVLPQIRLIAKDVNK
jgi:co-chaperonin GroES (HSP10)